MPASTSRPRSRALLTAAAPAVAAFVAAALAPAAAPAQRHPTDTYTWSGSFAQAFHTEQGDVRFPSASASVTNTEGAFAASASARDGTVRASARSAATPPRLSGNWGGTARATFWDAITLVPGRTRADRTVTWEWVIEGAQGLGRFGGSRGAEAHTYFGTNRTTWLEGRFDYTRILTGDTLRVGGSFEIPDDPRGTEIFYYANLSVWAFGSAYADYGNTMRFSWTVPEGVTVTSNSGRFVAPTVRAAVTVTPEPAPVALLAAGAAALGGYARRRRR